MFDPTQRQGTAPRLQQLCFPKQAKSVPVCVPVGAIGNNAAALSVLYTDCGCTKHDPAMDGQYSDLRTGLLALKERYVFLQLQLCAMKATRFVGAEITESVLGASVLRGQDTNAQHLRALTH